MEGNGTNGKVLKQLLELFSLSTPPEVSSREKK